MKWLKHLLWKEVTQDPQYAEVQIPCPEITIPAVPQELYDKLLSEATAAGAVFNGNEADWHGCTLDWNYDQSAQIITATCTKKPFYIGCSQIEQGLRNEVVKAKAAL